MIKLQLSEARVAVSIAQTHELGCMLLTTNGCDATTAGTIMEHLIEAAQRHGVTAIADRDTGRTGRLGAFAEEAAEAGCLFIACGGGARQRRRMIAPHGGSKPVLPTNPWYLGIPGGDQAPVCWIVPPGRLPGGWIYAACHAGARLPEGAIIDKVGNPSQDPKNYFDNGTVLPKVGTLGYGLATMAELI